MKSQAWLIAASLILFCSAVMLPCAAFSTDLSTAVLCTKARAAVAARLISATAAACPVTKLNTLTARLLLWLLLALLVQFPQ